MIASPVSTEKTKRSSGGLSSSNMGLFFAIAYFSQGISCAQYGVIAQPIQFFMMKGLELDSAQVASYMALMLIPWVVKPLYGLVSDFIPIFGYRRKSYLFIANVTAALAFLLMFSSNSLFVILASLMITAIAMAVATALMCGMAVEAGRANQKVRKFFTIQEIAYYSANIFAGLIGGILCQKMRPEDALHTAAIVAIVPLLIITFFTSTLVKEEKSKVNVEAIKATLLSLKEASVSRALRLVALFSFLWNFLPAFGVPLYFYESKTLGFAQASIGQLAGWNAAGMLCASFAFPLIMKLMNVRKQLYLTGILVALSTVSFLAMSTPESAILLEFFRGFANLIAILAIYGLAADVCPKRIEVSIMAILVALRNFATYLATYTGGQLFSYVFHGDFSLLLLFSLVSPLLSLLIVPLACRFREAEMK